MTKPFWPMTKPFWMVFREDGNAPTFKHDSRRSAELEAERLARACPGKRFFVLQAVSVSVRTPDVITTKLDADDEVPF